MTFDEADQQADLAKLRGLLQTLREIEATIKERKKGGKDFNLAALAIRNETALNAIIANFLDPMGDHGQETLFLEAFLKLLGLPNELISSHDGRWSVSTEVEILTGRIDICLVLPRKARIYIESKPWAGEGDAQLARYQRDLRDGNHNEPYKKLVFMSWPGNTGLTQDKESKLKVDLLPFHTGSHATSESVIGWLSAVELETTPPKLRIFRDDLVTFLRTRIGSDGSYLNWRESHMTNAFLENFEEHPELVELAFRMRHVTPEIEDRIYDKLVDEIVLKLEGAPTLNDWTISKGKVVVGIARKIDIALQHKSWIDLPVGIGISFDEDRRQKGFVGVFFRHTAQEGSAPSASVHLAIRDGKDHISRLKEKCRDVLHKISVRPGSQGDWPAYAYLSNQAAQLKDFTNKTYLEIHSDKAVFSGQTAAAYVANQLVALALASKETIDSILEAKPWARQ